jgi:hypothetical protein
MVTDEAGVERAGGEIRRWSASGLAEIIWPHDTPELRLPDGSFFRSEGRDVLSIVEEDPLSAKVTCHRIFHLGSADRHLRVEATATMSSTADDFVLDNELDAFEDDVPVAGRHWQKTIARDHV